MYPHCFIGAITARTQAKELIKASFALISEDLVITTAHTLYDSIYGACGGYYCHPGFTDKEIYGSIYEFQVSSCSPWDSQREVRNRCNRLEISNLVYRQSKIR